MRRELELKFRITSENDFINMLEEKGIVLSSPIMQDDIIFFRKDRGFSDLDKGEPVIRIRKQQDKIVTTLKKYKDGIADRVEVECEILDGEMFHKYLELLDLVPVVTVKKKRRKGNYEDASINVDQVEGLGLFVEVEVISDDYMAKDDMKKLNRIVNELGLSKNNIVSMPYDEMLFRKGE